MPAPLVIAAIAAAVPVVTGAAAVVGSWVDKTFNGGRFMSGFVKPAIQNIMEPVGEAQQDAAKQVGLYGFGKFLDIIGQVLTTISPKIGNALRSFGQNMMGVPEGERQFGGPSKPDQNATAALATPNGQQAPAKGTPIASLSTTMVPELTPTIKTADESLSSRVPETRSTLLDGFSAAASPAAFPNRDAFKVAVSGPTFIPKLGPDLAKTMVPAMDMALENNIG